MIVLTVIVGLFLGAATGYLFLKLANRKSTALLIVTALFGGLGAAAGDILLTWGLIIFGVAVAPVIAGGIVLPIVAIYGFYFFKNRIIKLRQS